MRIIKSSAYSTIRNEEFHIPVPTSFSLYYGDNLLANYKIDKNNHIQYDYDETLKIPIITSVNKDLTLSDICFLFNCRVFPKDAPFTERSLDLLGLEEYNPYEIVKRTHGVVPGDMYWIKFSDEDIDYAGAVQHYNDLFSPESKY